jgi:hypothetical protein
MELEGLAAVLTAVLVLRLSDLATPSTHRIRSDQSTMLMNDASIGTTAGSYLGQTLDLVC